MTAKNVRAPNLPLPPEEYDRQFMDKLLSVLRLYFTQLDNIGPIAAATEINGTDIVSGLSFFRPDPTAPNTFVISLPTQADFANLRSGDVYYDTSGGAASSYPLRIKA
jgi:hypothetical protein